MGEADLPLEMVPALLELGRALGAHARAHRDASVEAHEQGVLEAWRRVAPRRLAAVVSRATSGLAAGARPVQARCPGWQQRRPVQSRLGPIPLERPWHHCIQCGHGWSPSDQALGRAAYQQTSAGLARWEALLGASTTFKEAASLLAELAGIPVGAETLRVQAERVGTELEGQQRAAMAYVEAQQEPPPRERAPAPGVVVVETDGVMVRSRDRHPDGAPIEEDWHEVKLGGVGGWVGQRPRAQLPVPSSVAARAGGRPCPAAGHRVAPLGWHTRAVAARGRAGRWGQVRVAPPLRGLEANAPGPRSLALGRPQDCLSVLEEAHTGRPPGRARLQVRAGAPAPARWAPLSIEAATGARLPANAATTLVAPCPGPARSGWRPGVGTPQRSPPPLAGARSRWHPASAGHRYSPGTTSAHAAAVPGSGPATAEGQGPGESTRLTRGS